MCKGCRYFNLNSMTPIEIIDQMIEQVPKKEEFEDREWILCKARERIMNECTVRLSDGDNTYDIPYSLAYEFNIHMLRKPTEIKCDIYGWYDHFDKLYSQYKV